MGVGGVATSLLYQGCYVMQINANLSFQSFIVFIQDRAPLPLSPSSFFTSLGKEAEFPGAILGPGLLWCDSKSKVHKGVKSSSKIAQRRWWEAV
jgi:hypothetical protein